MQYKCSKKPQEYRKNAVRITMNCEEWCKNSEGVRKNEQDCPKNALCIEKIAVGIQWELTKMQ